MGLLSSIFGSKPKIPTLPGIESAQTDAVKANVASFGDIAKLATQVDTFNQDQLAALMEKQLPGGAGKIRDLISSRLAGEIPADTLRQMRNANAERGAGVLTSGSQFKLGSELASQLGMSLQLQNQGFDAAMKWMESTRTPTFDVSSMFLTPTQKYESNVNQWNRDVMEAKVKAAPDPGARGAFDTGMQILGMAMSAYGGGPGYTNTYNPNTTTDSSWGIGGSGFGFGRSSSSGWFLGKQPGKG